MAIRLEEFGLAEQKTSFQITGTGMLTCETIIQEINAILSPYGLEFKNTSKLEDEAKTYELDSSDFDRYATGDFDKDAERCQTY